MHLDLEAKTICGMWDGRGGRWREWKKLTVIVTVIIGAPMSLIIAGSNQRNQRVFLQNLLSISWRQHIDEYFVEKLR